MDSIGDFWECGTARLSKTSCLCSTFWISQDAAEIPIQGEEGWAWQTAAGHDALHQLRVRDAATSAAIVCTGMCLGLQVQKIVAQIDRQRVG